MISSRRAAATEFNPVISAIVQYALEDSTRLFELASDLPIIIIRSLPVKWLVD